MTSPAENRRTRPVALLYLVLALVFQLGTLVRIPEHDAATWLFMAQRQTCGQMPGRDLWDNKLPLIYLVGRAALASGWPQAFLWGLESALTAAGALAVAGIVRVASSLQPTSAADAQRTARAAVLAGSVLCIISGSPTYRGGGYLTEVYAMPLSAIAVWFALLGTSSARGAVWYCTAGLAWTLAVSFRLPVALSAFVITALIIGWAPRSRLRCVAAHVAGVAGGVAIVLAQPLWAGYLRDCVQAAVAWPLGLSAARIPGPLAMRPLARLVAFLQDLGKVGWLHATAMAGLLLAQRAGHNRVITLIAAWYLTAIASTLPGWAHYAHYHYVVFAPLCAACGLLALHWHAPRTTAALRGLVAFTVILVVAQNTWTFVRARPRATEPEKAELAAYLRTHSDPNDSALLWIDGHDAELLRRIDRPPGVRHFLARSYFDMDVALVGELATEFMAHPPLWLVQDIRDNEPLLTGPPRAAWEADIPALARLQEHVRHTYEWRETFGRFEVWRRR